MDKLQNVKDAIRYDWDHPGMALMCWVIVITPLLGALYALGWIR